eukprot:gnl/TRDRNA2_/TRDRNA2_85744_c0_seq2.p1 gnl/TRDRNA2_/TRDRNA2_85744_c0~~gnl/TRDRNA2_/TRDRNA2_85744_c0_seq2.p1  ORF type:complete len:318 (+),score=56.31 gnl/TRDRNA2_/TRDRNA2_85744_c0_seq2:73-1026(+)
MTRKMEGFGNTPMPPAQKEYYTYKGDNAFLWALDQYGSTVNKIIDGVTEKVGDAVGQKTSMGNMQATSYAPSGYAAPPAQPSTPSGYVPVKLPDAPASSGSSKPAVTGPWGAKPTTSDIKSSSSTAPSTFQHAPSQTSPGLSDCSPARAPSSFQHAPSQAPPTPVVKAEPTINLLSFDAPPQNVAGGTTSPTADLLDMSDGAVATPSKPGLDLFSGLSVAPTASAAGLSSTSISMSTPAASDDLFAGLALAPATSSSCSWGQTVPAQAWQQPRQQQSNALDLMAMNAASGLCAPQIGNTAQLPDKDVFGDLFTVSVK